VCERTRLYGPTIMNSSKTGQGAKEEGEEEEEKKKKKK
jgi:hypothetical protein